MRLSVRAGTIRLLSVTAVAATACALTVGAASAATATAATKHATKTKVSVAKSAYVGASVKLSATVTGAGSRPTGTVVFWFGSRKLCHGTLSKGSTHCNTSFSNAASKTITAKYGGNSTHKASSGTGHVNVVRSGSTTKINNTSPTNIDSGSKFTFNVTVSGPAGTPYATGNVVIAPTAPTGLPASFSCTATLTRGHGSCTITAGDYGIVDYAATYGGSSAHTGSDNAGFELAVQNVTSTKIAAVTASAGDVQVNADVYAMGANVDSANGGTGTVAFYLSDTAGSAGPAVADCTKQLLSSFDTGTGDNVATCGPANATLNALTAGTYYVTAVYSGDTVNVGSTSEQFTLTVS
jgi:hypothetical protein